MNQPLFSIITVVLNGAQHLRASIESVLNQDYPHVEHIVIDGGSTDGSVEIISSLGDALAYWVSEPDAGIYAAMNKGWRQAKGEWIGFLNADDFYVDGALSSVANYLANYLANRAVEQACDVVYGNMIVDGKTGRILVPDLQKMEHNMGVFHPATFVKRQVLEDLDGFDESFQISGDYDFMLRTWLSNYVFEYIDQPLTVFRTGGVSGSWKTYLEGYKIQRKYNLPAKNRMLMSMAKLWLLEQKQRVRFA